jgi:F-type H+-transporting ATPase subunit O
LLQYTAAAKTQSLDTVSRALENMASTFKKDSKLQSILTAPTLSASDKQQIVAEIQKSTGVSDKTKTVDHFLSTLAENNRLGVLEGVCEKFATLMSAARGEVEMTITSATPLDQKVVRQLEQAVGKSQYVGQGKKLKVVPKVSFRERRHGYSQTCGFHTNARICNRSTPRSAAASSSRSVTAPSISVSAPRWRG